MTKKRCKKNDVRPPKSPKYKCQKCGEEAKKKEHVCKPEKIKKEGSL